MSRPRTRVRARVLGHARDQDEQDRWTAMVRDVRALVARIDRGETTATPSRLRCLRALITP